jgi:predicted phosphodiesterase
MTTEKTALFEYHSQCLTCNLRDGIANVVHELFDKGETRADISRVLLDAYNISISRKALSNHFAFHTKKVADDAPPIQPFLGKAPKGWEPQATVKGDKGEVCSPAQNKPDLKDFSDILRFFQIDPDVFEVIDETIQVRQWQAYGGDWQSYYKFNIRKKKTIQDIAYIVENIKDVVPHGTVDSPGDYAFVFAAGDLQLGKSDADGTEGIVKRYRESLQLAVNKAHALRDMYSTILISWVGDCIEGMVSQGGRNARRTELSTTQQAKLLRLLMTETIKAFAPLTDDLRVVSVPGNHDEAQREPVATDFSDSWAVDALVAVSEALSFNPEAFGHVKCEVVPYDELTTTVEVAGSIITHAHGHQWARGKHWDWWSGQHWGDHEPGKADILICGHLHSGVYEQQNFKHMIRTPAFEKESTYFRHRTGLVGNPSAVTFLTRNGKIKFMDYE